MAHYWNRSFQIRENGKRLKSKTSMKRPGFKHVPGTARTVKVSPLKRSNRPMKKIGRRTKSWRYAWQFLKPRFEAAGRTKCEFGFIPHECGGFLTPAHSKKRRLMKGNDIFAIGMACINVHRILDEQMTHEEMEAAVLRVIEENGGMILPEQ